MDFEIPADLKAYLKTLDEFIEAEIKPLQAQDDNERFFDHRREWARTDFENGGLPRHEWEQLLGEMRRRADAAGHYRYALPKEFARLPPLTLAIALPYSTRMPISRAVSPKLPAPFARASRITGTSNPACFSVIAVR